MVFRKEDHVRLRDTLAGIEGKFMVSYNDCQYIRELYQDFRIEPVTRLNNLAQRYDGGCEFPEVLVANYDMNERRDSLPVQMSLFELYGEQRTALWRGAEIPAGQGSVSERLGKSYMEREVEHDSVSGDRRKDE